VKLASEPAFTAKEDGCETMVTGALTVTVNVPLLTLLAASVAVTVTPVVPSGNNVPLALEYAITGLALTSSVAVAAEYVTIAPLALVAVAVTFEGNFSTGTVASLTVTVNVPLLTLLAASVAVTVTLVVPSGNTVPLALEYAITGLALTSSVAGAAEYVTSAPLALVAVAVTFEGNVNTGAVVSLTVTVTVPLLTFPAASVAVTVTLVAPSGNNVPLALEYAITGLALTSSVAVAAE